MLPLPQVSMYLKSIEIQGFKSFANKIKLEFHDGFTAIVGPNGSGKSNVGDAVRWVLGEQSAKSLRGGNMQDVIFAGTELRKPLSYAYVAITMDNSDHRLPTDYQEVTVARRLFRSGESEYLINGVQVRLRDVQELFYDTGIGKEGYSIIGQGQIEKILSDKPEDRRELFDEAVGIVKYKKRKNEAQKKLDNEKANLIRVNDIVAELQKQVGPLERQSEKARIYLKTMEELRHLDANIFLLENGKNKELLSEAGRKLQDTSAELSSASSEFEKVKEDYATAQTRLETLEKETEEARNRINDAGMVRSRLEGNIKVYREQISSAEKSSEHFHKRESDVRAQLAQRQKEQEAAAAGRQKTLDEIAALVQRQRGASENLTRLQEELSSLSDEIEQKRNQILDLLNTRAQIKSGMAALSERKQQLELRKAALSSKLISVRSEESEHDRRLSDLQKAFQEAAAENADLAQKEKETEEAIAQKKMQLTVTDQKLRAEESQYHQTKSRLDALLNLTERYEGFGNAVRRVMECRDTNNGIVGVVADLIKTDPAYETAIETALGGSIQNIVTTDNATSKQMISLLKREKAGRATFLPLSDIGSSSGFGASPALKEPGVIGTADTLVRTAPEHRSVARHLLGRVLVVDTYDNAYRIAVKYQHKVRIVTLGGEQFNVGGSVSGGAFRNKDNLLGRRREIAELQKNAEEQKKQMEALEEQIENVKNERNVLRGKLENIHTLQQTKMLELNTKRLQIRQEEEKKNESSGNYDALRAENSEIEKTTQALQKEEEDIRAQETASLQFEKDTNAEIERLLVKKSELDEREHAEADVTASFNVEIEKKRQSAAFGEQELSRIGDDVLQLQQELSEILGSIDKGSDDIESRKRLIEETQRTLDSSGEALEKDKKLLISASQDKEELSSRMKKLFERRDTLSETKAQLDKEVYRLEEQKKRLEETIEARINYLWNEYELTPLQAEELREEPPRDLSEMKKLAGERKATIKGLGNVNVNAIEEYKSVSERYEFTKKQADDIMAAQKDLEQIIAQLDSAMRSQFRTQFSLIQKEFDKVFKELFGGGTGRLELVEDQDILEAGVRVIAQPPGKKLQNMMQMSGGEKSLTAISLLFAIQNLKPSPFCLLDEIEAALDESNVGRFAGYLHKLTKNTQFIVITHRRGTMDRADRLYGITMQEKGVSTLVSVSLIDDKDLTA